MKPTWETKDGSVRLFLGDSAQILPTFADRSFDACVTDPNYGIGEAAGKNKSRSNLAVAKDYGNKTWDDEPASPELIAHCRRVSKWQVIFGGNYFELPPSSCWLVWDKLNGENDFADCELAWTNLPKAVRRIAFRWAGMLRDEDCVRVHPTQKPVRVMQWCLEQVENSRTIGSGLATVIDPFAGSFTTAIACIRSGHRFVGIEREPDYFAAGVKRITEELERNRLFEPPPQIVQRSLITEAQ